MTTNFFSIYSDSWFSSIDKINLLRNTIIAIFKDNILHNSHIPVSDSEVYLLTGDIKTILFDDEDVSVRLGSLESESDVTFIDRQNKITILPKDKAKPILRSYPRFVFLNTPKLLEIYDS